MTLHVCRDFLMMHPTDPDPYHRYYAAYAIAMFLRGVLGYTQVGHTNFNLDGSVITKGSGTNDANVNAGAGLERAVQMPVSYTVSSADIDRILALKSNSNPMLNSGLFRVSGIDSTSNSLFMVARSWLEVPPAEVGVSWRLYENEATVTALFVNGANTKASGRYRGDGDATTSRIVLQSPHATAWQLRVCCETPNDSNGVVPNFACAPPCSVAPGFGGNAAGDFSAAGKHLHPAMFFDLSAAKVKTDGWLGGIASNTNVAPGRVYMWGDDATGTCVIITRQHGDTAWNGLCGFGLSEDEDLPLAADPVHRLFVFGHTAIAGNTMEMGAGPRTVDNMMGVAMGLGYQPVTCVPGSWQYMQDATRDSSIMHDTLAADSVYVSATELYGWDLYAGTWDFAHPSVVASAIQMEPRRLGRFPFARRGRENFNTFSTSVDAGRTWLHMQTGIYLPWSGSIVP